jgi:phthiodiolone/phenolphthiodiolone dimycocerosates ketoreductase
MCYFPHRAMPPRTVTQFARQFEESGAIDYLWCIDAIAGWFPQSLWTPEYTPLAHMGDFDSVYDAFSVVSMAAATSEKLGTLVSTNALRHGPAELLQVAMTLADATENGTIFTLGAGEAYNTVPFGYNRKLALSRMEDHFRIYRLLWECDGPVDYEGRVINLDQAFMGKTRGRRPEFWAMGAGPRLRRIAGQYADGWMTSVPGGIPNVEQYAKHVQEIKVEVEKAGRDPEAFHFGLMPCILLHDDPDVIDVALDNPVLKFFCSLFGRTNQAEWADEGIEAPFPHDWNYSLHYFPAKMTKSDVDAILARTPKEAVQKGWYTGSPKEMARILGDYIDAGCNFVAPYDFLPAGLSDLNEMASSFDRQVELNRLLKGIDT